MILYQPTQLGIPKYLNKNIEYTEYQPKGSTKEFVYCFWSLKTHASLRDNFNYIVLPDACLDFIFDMTSITNNGAFVMTPDFIKKLLT